MSDAFEMSDTDDMGDAAVVDAGFTANSVLGGRVGLLQPRRGERAAIDPVLLAAAVPAAAGEHVLEAGSGSGVAALCLAARCAGVAVTGLELDGALVGLAAENARRNGVADRVRFVAGDVAAPPPDLAAAVFDHAMANPPHLRAGTGRASPVAGRARAHVDSAGLSAWVRFLARRVRRGGTVTLVHRADRLDDILAAFAGARGLRVLPLWPGGRGGDRPAKRVIVQAVVDSREPLRLLPGLVLHREDGRYTDAADAVLRAAAALPL